MIRPLPLARRLPAIPRHTPTLVMRTKTLVGKDGSCLKNSTTMTIPSDVESTPIMSVSRDSRDDISRSALGLEFGTSLSTNRRYSLSDGMVLSIPESRPEITISNWRSGRLVIDRIKVRP